MHERNASHQLWFDFIWQPIFVLYFFLSSVRLFFCSVQTCGLGGMKPNTVILGWPYGWRQSEHDRTWKAFLDTCRVVASSRMALVIPKGINFFPDSTEKVFIGLAIFSICLFFMSVCVLCIFGAIIRTHTCVDMAAQQFMITIQFGLDQRFHRYLVDCSRRGLTDVVAVLVETTPHMEKL